MLAGSFEIIDRCFFSENILHKIFKIFNRNKVKLTYRAMGNLGSFISKQNKQILNKDKVEVVPHCNWPIQGNNFTVTETLHWFN